MVPMARQLNEEPVGFVLGAAEAGVDEKAIVVPEMVSTSGLFPTKKAEIMVLTAGE